MAVALLSHVTYFSELRTLPAAVVDATVPWTAFYQARRDLLTGGVVYPLLEDPLAQRWTALQAWNPEVGRGALLAFRQDDVRPAVTVALRNVRGDGSFDLLAGPTGERVATVTADQLRAGLRVELPQPRTAQVLLIVPASP
jgi:hypothetical protein